MSSYLLGAKAIKRLVSEKDPFAFYKAKFTPQLFRGEKELEIYKYAKEHWEKYQVLPAPETLEAKFPDVKDLETPEPSKYYLDLLDRRFGYDLINKANLESQEILKKNPAAIAEAEATLRTALSDLSSQRFRHKILDVGLEAPELLLSTYHNQSLSTDVQAYFGWPYMDDRGSVGPGNTVSIVGRPAMGKTYFGLYIALHNWRVRKQNVLFVSMEMNAQEIAQRIGAMYAGTNITQLSTGSYATPTFQLFVQGMEAMQQEQAKFYVVDGNLTAMVDETYALAEVLKCKIVFIDGAYMLKHPNPRLQKYDRVAENVELIKKATQDTKTVGFNSWQFSRQATGKGKGLKKGEKPGLEDIGYSDAIGQYSSIVLGIMQEEGVETIIKRNLDLLKGRKGEIGQFPIHWDFDAMDFTQYGLTPEESQEKQHLDYV